MSRGLAGGLAVAAVAALAGCSTLPDLDECGNGVVEPGRGEACDDGGASDTCSDACQLTCIDEDEDPPADYVAAGHDPDGLVTYCPAGRTCGADDVCRAPSGVFVVETDPFAIAGEQAEVGDVDGDQIDDLIVVGTSALEVRYGSAEVGDSLVLTASLPTPTITGRALAIDFFNSVDEEAGEVDGAVDLLAPSAGGLLEYVAADGALSAKVPLDALDPGQLGGPGVTFVPPAALTSVSEVSGDTHPVVVFTASTAAGAHVVIAGDPRGPGFGAQCPLGPGSAWQIVGEPGTGTARRQLAVAVGDGTAVRRLCVFSSGPTGLVGSLVTLPPGVTVDLLGGRLTYLADGPGCADLLVPGIRDGVSGIYRVTAAGSSCESLAIEPAPLAFAAPPGALAGSVVLEAGTPPVVALVAGNSFWVDGGLAWNAVAAFPLPGGQEWGAVATGDLDGSGRPALVAARRSVIDGAVVPRLDLDVIRVLGEDGAGALLFQQQVVDTTAAVVGLVAGDWNGDALADVAVVQAADQGEIQLGIAYGVRGSVPAEVTFVDDFAGVLLVARTGTITGALDPLQRDGLDDLVLIQYGAGEITGGQAFGTPLAGLAAPQWAALQAAAIRPRLDAVVATPDAAGDALDVTLFGGVSDPSGEVSSKWYWSAAGVGRFDATVTPAELSAELRGESAVVAAVARDGARAIVAANDLGMVSVDRPAATACAGIAVAALPRGRPRVRAVELDGSPGDELVFGMRGQAPEVYLASSLAAACEVPVAGALSAEVADAAGPCADAAPITVDPTQDAPPALAVACADGVAIVTTGAGATLAERYHLGDRPLIEATGHPFAVVPGDFDGDGVTDLVVLATSGSVTTAQLVRQCPAHDIDCLP